MNGRKGSGRLRKKFIGEMVGMAVCNEYSHMKTLTLKRK